MAPTPGGDAAVFDALTTDSIITLHQAPATDHYEFGGTIGTSMPPNIKIEIMVRGDSRHYYYCELYDFGASDTNFDLAYTRNGSEYFTGPITKLRAPLAN